MTQVVRQSVKSLLRRVGYDIVKHSSAHSPRVRRLELLRRARVSVVLDVGANIGQFGSEIREDGYKGRIVSFEPLESAFTLLVARADEEWECIRTAVGAADGEAFLHVSQNKWSSSLLAATPRLVSAAPGAATVSDEHVTVRALDSIQEAVLRSDDRAFLKIDTQGYEGEVLAGARNVLRQVHALQLELSLVGLYDGQPPVSRLLALAEDLGFALVDLSHGLVDPTSGELLQIDVLLARKETR